MLASVSKIRKNYPMMLEYSKQTLTAADSDSSFADIRDRLEARSPRVWG